jgi:hypothetical protein
VLLEFLSRKLRESVVRVLQHDDRVRAAMVNEGQFSSVQRGQRREQESGESRPKGDSLPS